MRSQDKVKDIETTELNRTNPQQNFLMGAALGAFVSIFLLSLSMSFGHVALADIGFVRPAIVLATTLIFGLLTIRFNGSFFNSLMNVLSNLGT